MLGKLLPFEFQLQFRQIGFWITIAFLFIAVVLFSLATFDTSGERILANGALLTAAQISSFSMLSIFFGAVFVVSGVMRDEVSGSLEIIHATPVQTAPLVLARYIGAYFATFAALLAMVLGVFVSQFLPWVDSEVLGPVNLLYYLQPTLIFVAVNALLITAIFCTVAMITRSRAMVYVSAVALLVLYMISTSFVSDDRPELLVSLLDPFGTIALSIETAFWSPEEQNTQLVPFAGYVLINRLVWGGIGLALFAFCFLRFTRGIVTRSNKNTGGAVLSQAAQEDIALHTLAKPISNGGFRTLLTRIRFEYLTTIRSIAFMILTGLVLVLSVLFILVGNLASPDPSLPTNRLMSALALTGTVFPLLILSIFFSGEIIWRDRAAKMTELIDSTRTQNWPLMAGKWIAMLLVVITIIFGSSLMGMAAQLALGDVSLNLATHFGNAFMSFAPSILFYCTLIMFIQNFMPNKVVGMIVGGVIVAGFIFGVGLLPFFHPLMAFGNVPDGGLSEMNGFGDPGRYWWFMTYWLGLAGLFSVASIWLWRRGVQTGLMTRIKSIRSQMSLPSLALGAASLIAFVGAGIHIYTSYETNNFQTRSERSTVAAELERDYEAARTAKLPKVRDVEMTVLFHPETKSVQASGTYVIENTTGKPLSELYISGAIDRAAQVNTLTIQGAKRVESDALAEIGELGFRLYKFDRPLGIGATTRLNFDVTQPTPTLGGRQQIRNNGTFVNHQQIAPVLGLPDFRLRNPDRRRRQGLPNFIEVSDRTDEDAREDNFFSPYADYVSFKATVCTAPGQIPIAPGRAVRIYEQDGRPCRDYLPNEPIAFFFAFVSADYETIEDSWRAPTGETVDLAIYYDRQHDYNVDLMMQAMKDSLDTFTDVFGPYQYETLRIMEFPYANFAQSFAGTIPFSENIGFVRDPGDKEDNASIDLATYVTMHEIGHQWFGHQIVPANVEGFNVLSEGLTENAAMTAYERTYGWQKARRILENRSIQQYLTGRTLDSAKEPPLATAGGGQQYIIYSKASWVFWGLKQYIGEDEMQGAIRNLLADYGGTGSPYPTTIELIDHLRTAAGPDYQQLITDYFERLTFWDMEFDSSETQLSKTASGKFKVDVAFNLDKQIASGETGRAVSILEDEYAKPEDAEDDSDAKGDLIRKAEALNEWIEIGFYENDPDDTLGDEWIKLERVHITEPEVKLSFELDTKPSYIVLDPRRLLIERNVDDNEIELTLPDES